MSDLDDDINRIKVKNNMKFDDVLTKANFENKGVNLEAGEIDELIDKYMKLDYELNGNINSIFRDECFVDLLERYNIFECDANNDACNYKNERTEELNKIIISEDKYRDTYNALIDIKKRYKELNSAFLNIKKNELNKKFILERIKHNEIKFNRSSSHLNNPLIVSDNHSKKSNDNYKLLLLDIRIMNNSSITLKENELLLSSELIQDMLNRNKIYVFTNNADILLQRHMEDIETLNKKDQDYYYIENLLRNKVNSIYNENVHLKEKINNNLSLIYKKDCEINKLTTILNSMQTQIDDSINSIRSKLKSKYGNCKLIHKNDNLATHLQSLSENDSNKDPSDLNVIDLHNCISKCPLSDNVKLNQPLDDSKDHVNDLTHGKVENVTIEDIRVCHNNEDNDITENVGVNVLPTSTQKTESIVLDTSNYKQNSSINLDMDSLVLTPIETNHKFVENVNIQEKSIIDTKSKDIAINSIDNDKNMSSTTSDTKANKEEESIIKANDNDDYSSEKIDRNENANIVRKCNKRHNFLLQNYREIDRKDIKVNTPESKLMSSKINDSITKKKLKEKSLDDSITKAVNQNQTSVPISKKRTKSRERNIFERSTYTSDNSNLMFKSVTKNDVFLFNSTNDSIFNVLNESSESAKVLSKRNLKKVSNSSDSIIPNDTKNRGTTLVQDSAKAESQKINDQPTSKVYKATVHNNDFKLNGHFSDDKSSRYKGVNIKDTRVVDTNINGTINSHLSGNNAIYSDKTYKTKNNDATNHSITKDINGLNNTLYRTSISTSNRTDADDSVKVNKIKVVSNDKFNTRSNTDDSITNFNIQSVTNRNNEEIVKGNNRINQVNNIDFNNTLKNLPLIQNKFSPETTKIQRNNTAPLLSYGQYQTFFPFNSNNYMPQLSSYNSMPQYVNTNGIHYVGYGTIPNNIAFQGINKNLLTSIPMQNSTNVHTNTVNGNLGAK